MPVPYKGYTVPELDDPAHAPDAFKQFADSVIAAGGGGVPVGTVLPYVGSTAPDASWKICDGSDLDVTIYNELFAVIGSNFGSASAGFFKIPDMRGAMPRGAGASGLPGGWDGGALGSASGSTSVTLTEANMPSHTHNIVSKTAQATDNAHSFSANVSVSGTAASGGGHTHSTNTTKLGSVNWAVGGGGNSLVSESQSSTRSTTSSSNGAHTHSVSATGTVSGTTVPGGGGRHDHAINTTTHAAGSGTAFSVTPPGVAFNFIIKVKP